MIAIIGILTAVLVPSLVGYVNKARRRTDAANAKELHNEFTLLLDETLYDGFNGNKETASHDYDAKRSYKTVHTVTVKSKGKEENYQFHVVAKCAGAKPAQSQPNSGGYYHWNGNTEANAIYAALEKDILNAKKPFPIPIQSKSYNYKTTDLWLIGYRGNDRSQIEIWVGNSTGKWASEPRYRLYPDPSDEYK